MSEKSGRKSGPGLALGPAEKVALQAFMESGPSQQHLPQLGERVSDHSVRVSDDVLTEQDRLTAAIASFEKRLAEQPWRCDVIMKIDAESSLSFKRVSGQWKLVWHWRRAKDVEGFGPLTAAALAFAKYEDVETCVTDTGTYRKSAVCELLPRLVDAMKTEHSKRVEALRKGFGALGAVENLLSSGDVDSNRNTIGAHTPKKEGK
jgi:hypothetical protein